MKVIFYAEFRIGVSETRISPQVGNNRPSFIHTHGKQVATKVRELYAKSESIGWGRRLPTDQCEAPQRALYQLYALYRPTYVCACTCDECMRVSATADS